MAETVRGCTHESGCHDGSLPTLASATVGASAWLLVEYPGPWGSHVEEMTLPPAIRRAADRARAAGVRTQLIRRPLRRGERRGPATPFQVYVGHSAGGEPWLEGRALGALDDLDALDLEAVAAGRRTGLGPEVTEPVLLVCTHAQRNACCARLGRPLAQHLREGHGDLVWETTHVGGDRFAGNLVCLPHGLYYGALAPAFADQAVAAYRKGEVCLERLRGRSGRPEAAQAAEHFVREHTGLMGLSEVVVERLNCGDTLSDATVRAAAQRFSVTVQKVICPPPCASGGKGGIMSYRLAGMAVVAPAAFA
ncbi:MAG: sucrase ferredoxin [Streptosporangiales bacterium]|nr:sucrase ferredoxin [Streptosporangiales bacterium]